MKRLRLGWIGMRKRLLRLKCKCRLSSIHMEGLVQSVVFEVLICRLRRILGLDVRDTGMLS